MAQGPQGEGVPAMRARFREEPKKEHVTLAHGPNCQCVAHRLERFVQRCQAAQVAADTIIGNVTMRGVMGKRRPKATRKTAKRAAKRKPKPQSAPEHLANPAES